MTTAAPTRPFVVIENGDPRAAASQARDLALAGMEAATCPGPRRLRGGGCPLLTTGDCFLLDRADALLYDLALDDAHDRAVLSLLRLRYPRLPVVVETPTEEARRHDVVLAGCTVIPPFSGDLLVSTIGAAAGA